MWLDDGGRREATIMWHGVAFDHMEIDEAVPQVELGLVKDVSHDTGSPSPDVNCLNLISGRFSHTHRRNRRRSRQAQGKASDRHKFHPDREVVSVPSSSQMKK
eukprot:CAMPEP_0185747818 /NCGR_PEP_ID=MMETSP1174-20130828/6456_1 /TAXON_ID=35687 /ORGANISM="Dictyocha speculum, Strain CCMP1381" /LENGTH=102 /DNA_ID=CAMNT_0028423173 /DNA_START=101 /DNA_END=406 /DNA_ORIENTATION=+